jgi:glycosyltransferase involved in cell wall biosynthesis
MKILVFTLDFYPRIGGIQTMTLGLMEALGAAGHDVLLIAPPGSETQPGKEPNFRLKVDEQARPQARFGKESLAEDRRITRLVHEIRRDFPFDALILMHCFYYAPAVTSIGKALKVPTTMVFYGFELRSQLVGRPGPRQRFRAWISRSPTLSDRTLQATRRASKLAAISRYTADLVRQTGARGRLDIIGCGITPELLEAEAALTPRFDRDLKRRRRLALGLPAAPAVGFVGRLVDSKNVELLLDAVAAVPEVQGLIVGDGPLRSQLEARASRLGIADRVTFTGPVEEERKWELMRAMDMHCLLSKEMEKGQVEGFGIVILEAAAAGTPSIGANSGGIPDPLCDGRAGIVVPSQSVEEVGAAIRKLLHDDELSGRFVDVLRDEIRNRFNWEAVARRLVS